MTNGAVVFGGGGVAGIAWEIGVLHGIRESAPEIFERIADETTLFVGTSAGSAVAAQVASGEPLDELLGRQLSDESAEIPADIDMESLGALMQDAYENADSPEEVRRRLGRMAAAAQAVAPAVRRKAIEARLPVTSWPTKRVLITGVDIDSGELEIFDAAGGVSLVDAVSASCAVPGVWPVVDIGGRRFMDGGMRSMANADLAAGSDPVLIIVPSAADTPWGPAIRPDELEALGPAQVHTIFADDASVAAFGPNPLDPSVRAPAARAGQDVGRRAAATIAQAWH